MKEGFKLSFIFYLPYMAYHNYSVTDQHMTEGIICQKNHIKKPTMHQKSRQK